MSLTNTIRHSVAGRLVRFAIHSVYHYQHPDGKPVLYYLPEGVDLQLYPEGEVAEWLAFPRLFEKTELALAGRFLRPGMNVIDVGANIGLYSIYSAKRLKGSGQIWAFEPSEESFRRLKKNLALNQCTRVVPVRAALSNEDGTNRVLKSDTGYGDAYRYLAAEADGGRGDATETVPVTTLDGWMSENGRPRVDFIKVDVEGSEYRVLGGAEETIRSSRDVMVFFESDPDWCRRAGCRQQDTFDLLTNLGLGLFSWNGTRSGWTSSPKALLNAGMVWACRDKSRLPVL